MTRRDFVAALPAMVILTAGWQRKRKPTYRTVVKPVRAQQADGTWIEAWSEVKPPEGRKAWTAAEIKKHGYKVITREIL